ncbi:4Fe-4S single cluster domain-containing protein [Agrococcus sp. SGAir0287]|uniref:4Fe-4S single cluster domain-containing protein n=1 Tax=Agrococcus sp. SGAir0287 TaxID=2070347 RepID=UPI0010CD1C30|nr:4Fe-4S single cluster domain-containing protein [Agrococcus sp. SGAir0287]QCR20280.1 radical SAM protein [Agrococcus sp. SGAir0287]
MTIRVARVLHGTVAEGPGRRTAVWFQGCSIRCRGCVNPHLFRASGGHLIEGEDVVRGALESGDEGLTLIGGEPFDQASGAGGLAVAAQEAGLGVLCFTGYLHEALQTRGDAVELLSAIDLLIDGPFVAERPEQHRPLVGSTNQRLIHLTERYRGIEAAPGRNRIEVRVGVDGAVDVAGFTDRDGTSALRGALGRRRPG